MMGIRLQSFMLIKLINFGFVLNMVKSNTAEIKLITANQCMWLISLNVLSGALIFKQYHTTNIFLNPFSNIQYVVKQ